MSDGGEASVAATATAPEHGLDGDARRREDPADAGWLAGLGAQAREWYSIARRQQDEGQLAMAASLLVRASCLEPDSAQLREVAARGQFRAGHYLGAHATFSGMLALAPKDDFALYASSVCSAYLGWMDHAVTGLTEAVGRRPDIERYSVALQAVRQIIDELDGAEAVKMPSYEIPPIPIDVRLLRLELGPRPEPAGATS